MTTGTQNFKSEAAAARYYSDYGYSIDDVREKIGRGEISIGRPKLNAGESLLIDEDGRYHIRTASKNSGAGKTLGMLQYSRT